MKFLKRLPTELSESQIRFVTFFNYFKAIQLSYSVCDLSNADLLIKAMKNKNPNLNRKRALDSDSTARIQKSLYHSWISQIHLEQYRWAEANYIGLSLQWLPTMFYYTFYHSVQAYFAASGKPHTPNHTEVLRVLSNDSRKLPGLMGVTCAQAVGTAVFSGLQIQGNNSSFSNLTRPSTENCQQFLAKFLKTTRDDILKAGLSDLRNRLKRKNLTLEHKLAADQRICPVGIPHFLYRARKRFNYEDSEIIHLGNTGQVSITEMYRAIRNSYYAFIVSFEWLAATYAGKNNFSQIYSQFRDRQKNKMAEQAIGKLDSRVALYF